MTYPGKTVAILKDITNGAVAVGGLELIHDEWSMWARLQIGL